ncbi:indolepyruvate ferredoxin oxidoreductase subunit alpha [Patescibacteria group bacterium]|nr:indolepyruvate ferredoxin oxidoreductase subunit alpha [Patescibacteria group bacterium]MBU4078241.1 indolepyruvate ferredoxin oxidoreductase subunit alpha [Patescibacteria group bacterium]
MNWENIFLKKQSGKEILLGNNAIIRGALESGVQFVSAYPGTPSSEIGDNFSYLSKHFKTDFYFEYSINEKVAMEAAIGASFSNLKCLVAMKHFGLNVASDALLPFVYTGVKGPTVISVSDDPSCHSSGQSEQNTRAFAELAHIPILEPSDSQECKDFVKLGFEISEKFKIPVLIRTTTRVAHQSGIVKLDKFKKSKNKAKFVKNYNQFVTMPPRVLAMHDELLEKIQRIKEYAEKSEINTIENSAKGKIGIITSSVSYLYVMEVLDKLNLKLPVFKIGIFYPLASDKLKQFIKNLDKVLIVEELEPYLERETTIAAKDINPKLKIYGKEILPETRELRPEQVTAAIAWLLKKQYKLKNIEVPKTLKRFPSLCAGCPYWLVFNGIKEAVKQSNLKQEDVVFGGGIGCYMLASFVPHNLQDYLFCMGSSIGIAHGIKKANPKQKLISLVGDSSFFHASMPALANAVHNQSNPLIIIMNNSITAMTGQQPYPGITETGRKEKGKLIKIEEVVKALGVENLRVIDPNNYKEFVKTVKDYLNKNELAVIIARSPCLRIKK